MNILYILFFLIVGHAIWDFPLQGDAVAINKNRHANTPLQKAVPWYYWNLAHALTHGGMVALITGSVIFGILETIAHFLIDFCKSEKWINIHQDQLLHILCKIIWMILWFL